MTQVRKIWSTSSWGISKKLRITSPSKCKNAWKSYNITGKSNVDAPSPKINGINEKLRIYENSPTSQHNLLGNYSI